MNATAAKTTAPAADGKKPDFKAIYKEMPIAKLSEEIHQLGIQLAAAEDSEEAAILEKLKAAKAERTTKNTERASRLDEVNNLIADYGFKLSELNDAARAALGASAVTAKPAKAADGAPRQSKKTGVILISAKSPSGRGIGATFNEGQEIPATVPAGFKAIYENNKSNFEEKLADHFSPEGKKYFGNPDNEEVLKKVVEWIKTKPLQGAKKS